MLENSTPERARSRQPLVSLFSGGAGKSFDYIVHVQSTHSVGYNPEVRVDCDRMALQILGSQCRAGRIVGNDKFIPEIWGITSSPPDYIVLVKCA